MFTYMFPKKGPKSDPQSDPPMPKVLDYIIEKATIFAFDNPIVFICMCVVVIGIFCYVTRP